MPKLQQTCEEGTRVGDGGTQRWKESIRQFELTRPSVAPQPRALIDFRLNT